MPGRRYYVYVMANLSRTLYVGVTGDLERRVWQHKTHRGGTFTAKYGLNRLVYLEEAEQVLDAISREKQIKGWLRAKKLALIETLNPDWQDLSAEWFGGTDSSGLRPSE